MFRAPYALALFAAPTLAIAAPATGDLALVQHHLQSVETLTASFSQTDRAGKVLTGVLTLKKPGKIRFQYEKGVPILIVGDGHALTFIDYSVRQVQRWPIGNSPLAVLLDPTRDMTRVAKVVPTPDPRMVSVEANDPKHPEYGRITLVFVRMRVRAGRPDASGLGRARLAEQPHHHPSVEPAHQCAGERQDVPVERPTSYFSQKLSFRS